MNRALLVAWLTFWCLSFPLLARADVDIVTSSLKLRFTDQGKLVKAGLCYPDCRENNTRVQEIEALDGIIDFGQGEDRNWVLRRQAGGGSGELLDAVDQHLQFSHASGRVVQWTIPSKGYRIEVRATGGGRLTLRAGAEFAPRPAAGFGNWLEQMHYVAAGSRGFEQFDLDDTGSRRIETEWAGFRNRFWAVLVRGQAANTFEFQAAPGDRDAIVQLDAEPSARKFMFYLGPVDPLELAVVNKHLVDLVYGGLWSWLRWICFGLYYLLGWIHAVIPEWGIAILVLSPVVSVLMLPLSRFADRLQRQVSAIENRLEPELFRIKRDYRGEDQTARIFALYQAEGVHPLYSLKSLVGVAVVIPVFIGAFDMLAGNIHLLHTGFLWVKDLSRPDALMQLPFNLPFFGSELNLLPFLMTGLSFGASWLHQPAGLEIRLRRRRRRNMSLLALSFFALFYTFPAGMVLYWTSNNLISLVKSFWVRG